ncbi:ATP-dependent DNA helicase [Rathayibacter iranicus]|uniref:DNA 3'-5' helicase n=2 Tax=Rathayibacter iranicus TaxID=59737 RepID=A0AAD1EKZ5_9MICO|nr:ATP-dependent DNA helicase [Rathayibacter iranicus]AZZ54597.1 ATP-dependent helicase [Rathayibacter iranicus]MWV30379.1 AAA family ATPase [Rathayibacter iranicus NCPPB 2253 = VKM Ac-1602]PPI51418.1 ATP-dependent DNA helicase [Rathayibacter iranicus]PPI63377.1 ATP-dependent DNA helicase [Rathayibacter iranicus]PPI74087.1 ATP-dependent DNA helicase [Rathayibacter iranicus]
MIDALTIAERLDLRPPTIEQRAVIEAPLRPALVVAGAGSGKTETMANRVLWLLANGLAAPSEVLGLTFTRKAATELGERIGRRIDQLGAAGLLRLPPGQSAPDLFEAATVSTYNAFANTIFRDNAALIGREGDATVLSEASAWHLARGVVADTADPRILDVEAGIDRLTDLVVSLAHDLADNLAEPAEVAAFAEDFLRLGELPRGGSGSGVYRELEKALNAVSALPVLTALAERFQEAKAERGFVEFSDQVALARRIVERVPRIADEYRARYRVVLLDEYQDTSVLQTQLLARLFAGQGVMAVGDPHQSIYGWRGASAEGLGRFSVDFEGEARFSLSTSWRNGHGVLAAANAVVEPLSAGSAVPVDTLAAGPGASGHPVELTFPETIEEEADDVARWFAGRLRESLEPPSAAILFRVRAHMDRFAAALAKHGVRYHILGIGGLLRQPEIADLVAALTVVEDPAAGSELVRLLAGARWRLGVRDLKALRDLASWLAARDHAHRLLPEEVRERMRASVTEGEGGSIVEALDFIAARRPGEDGRLDHSALGAFSEEGLRRLRQAGTLVARLRARAGLDLLDFVTLVEQELGLDIEVEANESRSDGRANLEAFREAVAGYLQTDDRGAGTGSSLRGFLRWLVLADKRDGLAPRPEDPEPGTVQLLTIHGSKGLEWDLVAVPRMVDGELPGTPVEGFRGWVRLGAMPYAFRGDAAELPDLAWRGCTTQKEVVDAIGAFGETLRERNEAEERRLAYVAVTRARHHLLLTGSWWAGQAKPRGPGVFLRDLEEAGTIPALPTEPADLENPLERAPRTFRWPHDPLGSRGERVRAAAARVHTAEPALLGARGDDIRLLLAERAVRLAGGKRPPLPTRIPASRFKDIVSTPDEVSAQLRRPMPERPYRQTRLGTTFHSWVENRFGIYGGAEAVDTFPDELDQSGSTSLEHEQLALLIETFERSEWADRRPDAVEIEIHLQLAGHVVVCKLDAVYRTDAGVQIVDWKTGRAPKDAADLELKQFQLALYRLAYSRWRGVPLDSVDAVFYFVADDLVLRPERFYSERELAESLSSATGASPRP